MHDKDEINFLLEIIQHKRPIHNMQSCSFKTWACYSIVTNTQKEISHTHCMAEVQLYSYYEAMFFKSWWPTVTNPNMQYASGIVCINVDLPMAQQISSKQWEPSKYLQQKILLVTTVVLFESICRMQWLVAPHTKCRGVKHKVERSIKLWQVWIPGLTGIHTCILALYPGGQ